MLNRKNFRLNSLLMLLLCLVLTCLMLMLQMNIYFAAQPASFITSDREVASPVLLPYDLKNSQHLLVSAS